MNTPCIKISEKATIFYGYNTQITDYLRVNIWLLSKLVLQSPLIHHHEMLRELK